MNTFFRPRNYALKIHPSFKYAWVNIPKNCSSFVQKVLDDNNWLDVPGDMIDGILKSDTIEKLVILRDPVQRWISGFAETFGIQDNWDPILKIDLDKINIVLQDETFWKILYNNPVMCHHTELQHRYIANAENVIFISMMDKHVDYHVADPNKFYKTLAEYILYTGGQQRFSHWNELTNPVNNDKNKVKVYNIILEALKNNPSIKNELRDCHADDYDLFNNLKRFETNDTRD